MRLHLFASARLLLLFTLFVTSASLFFFGFIPFRSTVSQHSSKMAARALTSVVVPAKTKHTATIIFLHGLGDSGSGWEPVGRQLTSFFPHVKFVFPNAPSQPVTINNGYKMPSWYDILSLSRINTQMDEKGMLQSVADVNAFIGKEIDAGIPASKVVIGGFSQGGAISLLTGITTEYKLAAVVALSTYLPLSEKIFMMAVDANKQTPIFMGHGTGDQVVQFEFGNESAQLLTKNKYKVDFKTYPGMPHSTCAAEIKDLIVFLRKHVPA